MDSLVLRAEQLNREHRKRGRRRLWLSALSLVVVLGTIASMMLPAFTQEKKTYCGLEEHAHSEACYSRELICGLAETLGHTHDESCYETASELVCPLEESAPHTHDESCYETVSELVCGLEENENHSHGEGCYAERRLLVCPLEESEGHTHGEGCYAEREILRCPLEECEAHTHGEACYGEPVLSCGLEEHEHSLQCYSDPEAVETEEYWRGSFPALGAFPAENAAAIALSQLGYHESAENYRVTDGGVRGYTRYGDWYGDPYGDWCAMFASFCLYYAGIGEETVPYGHDCAEWADALRARGLYTAAGTEGFAPRPGDIVFTDLNGDGLADCAGLAVRAEEGLIGTVEGDRDGCVLRCDYAPDDARLLGFGVLPDFLRPAGQTAANEADETEEEADGAAELPAQSFRAELEGLTVAVEAEAGAFPANTVMRARLVPAEQVLDAVSSAVEDRVVWVQAVDICFYDEAGDELQPRLPIRVSIVSDQLAESESVSAEVVHVDGEGDARVVEQAELPAQSAENEVVFEAGSFSIYALVGTVIEKQVLASDGQSYHISVSFGEDAQVPEGASLAVDEINVGSDPEAYAAYTAKAMEALGLGGVSGIRLFDIRIVDADGEKVTIAAPVDVRIELAETLGEAAAQVVHFADDAAPGDVVEKVERRGEAICFAAEGFSAYAIVAGPSGQLKTWLKVSSLEELSTLGADGFCIGHVDGYYLMNTLTGNNTRMGITKTTPPQSEPGINAARYYFEPVSGTADRFYIYCYNGQTRQYVRNANNNSLTFADESGKTAFTVELNGDVFTIRNGQWFWNMQGGASGSRFCCYNTVGDPNNNLHVWYSIEPEGDPLGLDGKSFGLMNWNGGPAGKALMAEAAGEDHLSALPLAVMLKSGDSSDRLFVPNDSDISQWRFEWIDGADHYLTSTVDGSIRYLRIDENGLSMVSTPDEACVIEVLTGSGVHEGQLALRVGSNTLTFSGSVDTGFSSNGSVGTEWLNLVELSELTPDYFMTFSAEKVSVSDPGVTTGTNVIVYTRSWNEQKKRYEFYAIDHDGSLVRCYESGDDINWVGNRINTLLWQFTEYLEDGQPSYYYELYNQYSGKYLAPQLTDGQIVSDGTIGINLNGRRDGQYFSGIAAWDDLHYEYAGLKVENGQIVSCPLSEGMDFYFAVVQNVNVDDILHTVPTVDHVPYGITMKIIDIRTREEMRDVLGNNEGGLGPTLHQGLLSTQLQPDGYPTAAGGSLGQLYRGARTVNNLFLDSVYRGTGYFQFDSTQNFASLHGSDFTVYQELGSYDNDGGRSTLQHGQFLPFNDLQPGLFTSVNKQNLYSVTAELLPDTDPRKYEQLYLVRNTDFYFALELEASFSQTPDGLDAWGHDIIFEFTGDDDFWLYVDDELILDLGGIHSAVPGWVNYRTGEVYVNGTNTTLRALFENNYRTRHPQAPQAEVDAFLLEHFEPGSTVFRDYSTHRMRIFYMERGAGASNLYMRFNLASIRPGTVLLSKELAGVDTTESVLAEFPYQILYTLENDSTEYYLQNSTPGASQSVDYVFYEDTTHPVTYKPQFTVDGLSYNDVFLLRPGEAAEISFPEGMESYRIIECGLNTEVYTGVSVNGTAVQGSGIAGRDDRMDYGIGYASTQDRTRVNYINTVDPDALRTLSFTKRLFREDGVTEIRHDEDGTVFSFRLYLGTESEQTLPAANMHTYHVRDENGNYCAWDVANQRFVSLGVSDYTLLTDGQKRAASFSTSMNGAITKIPVEYTVELRELLVGTKFKVVERPWEIPDGYSFQKYLYEGSSYHDNPEDGVSAVVGTGQDPHVDVCNLKGWGLRVRKIWTDAEYMQQRDPVYFGVFAKHADDQLTLVPDTLRRMEYELDPQTLYWYFPRLPDADVTDFENYLIREVSVVNPTVDDEGYVTAYDSLALIEDEVVLSGMQKGETAASPFSYSVLIDKGVDDEDSNVRVDTVTNGRPGIVLRKQDWDGHALAGAGFTLTDGDGNLIGSFESGADGMITVAYLRDDTDYILTETRAPQGWYGLQTPITIRIFEGLVTVSGADAEWYILTQAAGDDDPTLTVKNRPNVFEAIKLDADTGSPMSGAAFALHRQVTVDDVTIIDLYPMPGYENLVTGQDGLIPQLDNSLPPGTYELREKAAPEGYRALSAYIRFTVGPTGAINLLTQTDEAAFTGQTDPDGTQRWLLTVSNTQVKKLRFRKVDSADTSRTLAGAEFDLYRAEEGSRVEPALISGLVSRQDGLLEKNGETVFVLPTGDYLLAETKPPDGYVLRTEPVEIHVGPGPDPAAVTYDEGGSLSSGGSGKSYDAGSGIYTFKVSNSGGFELPETGGVGTGAFRLGGAALILTGLLFRFRRRRRERGDAVP